MTSDPEQDSDPKVMNPEHPKNSKDGIRKIKIKENGSPVKSNPGAAPPISPNSIVLYAAKRRSFITDMSEPYKI